MKHRFLLFSLFLALAQLSVFADNRGRERVSASHLSPSALQQRGAAREGVLKHSPKRLAAQAESGTVQIPTIWGAMIYANSWQDESLPPRTAFTLTGLRFPVPIFTPRRLRWTMTFTLTDPGRTIMASCISLRTMLTACIRSGITKLGSASVSSTCLVQA